MSQEDKVTFIRRFSHVAGAALLAGSATLAAFGSAHAADEGRPELSPIERVISARAKAATNKSDSSDRVFGGNEADPGEWPFQVALLASERLDESPASQPNAQFCGGSLISEQWVLTAAHCLFQSGANVPAEAITVLTGATDLGEGKRYKVAEVIVHEGYSEMSLDNDIGLLKLAEPATGAPTIKIGDALAEDASGKSTVTGWGMMDDGTFPNGLMEADLDLVPNAACNAGIKEIYARDLSYALRELSFRMRYNDAAVDEATKAITKYMADPLTNNMLCAGTESGVRDACSGDSGGPLFIQGSEGPEQVGIVSWGEGPFDAQAPCGIKGAYGVYTRLGNYKDWVAAKMGG